MDRQSDHNHGKGCEQVPAWIAQQAGKGNDAKINAGYDKKYRVLIREFRGMAFEEAKLPEIIKDRLQVGSIHDESVKEECASKSKKMIIQRCLALLLYPPIAGVDGPDRF